ncbi:polysaccharide lyase family 8 super-sandwich domain-containing protein [Lacipirellula sp.]|uniref:polysaccharide lyase 8 family protein n=1 Tax=Lacipirellula sp. TaxID=2691419 RepID=UPI003D0CE53B
MLLRSRVLSITVRTALLAIAIALTASFGRPLHADDLATVRDRLVADLLSSVPSASTVNGYRSSLSANGSWSDVDYGSLSRVDWEPMTHLTRLTAMAEAYSSSSNALYQNTALRDDILKAYDYWISRNPLSDNWYYNEISAPQELGNAMVLINSALSSSRRNSGLDVLERAYRSRSTTSLNTGMNRVERAMAGISRGVVAGSNSITADAFAAIGDTLVVTTGEGIQRDGSFHQHGRQLYNQGYGSSFIGGVTQALELNGDTNFAFAGDNQQALIDYMLDGTQWMVRGQVVDYTASGREITRKGQDDNAAALSGQLKTIIDSTPGYRSAELTAFRERILAANSSGVASPTLSLSGNKHFWRSDFTVHQRPDFYASVKLSSTRTVQPETGNNEGLKNLYLSDGVNLIMRTGNEYDNIMPVWNWRRLPGTTVEQDSRSLKPTDDFGVTGTSTYAGGVSDGEYGASAFKYNRFNVKANKSWFFFDDEFVALGAAIDAPNSVNNVNTTVNQTLLKGTVSYKTADNASRQTIALGQTVTPNNLEWVFHDGIGYFFPTPVSNATFRAYTQTGTWESINERYDDTAVSKDVFTLYLNHGNGFTGGSYNYIAVPGLTVGEMDGYLAANSIEILRNTSAVQAVRQSSLDVTQAAFYSASSLNLGNGQSFAVSDPSTVIMRRPTNALQFTASSPEAKSLPLAIDLNSVKFAGSGSSWLDGFSKSATVSLGLPSGDRAGASVGIAISTDAAATPTIRFTTFDQPTTFGYVSDASLTLPANTTLYAGSNKTLTFNGAITGNASLTKSGESDLNLKGANGYRGGTTVLGGNVAVSGDQRAADGGWTIGPNNASDVTVDFLANAKVNVGAAGRVHLGNTTPSGEGKSILNAAGTVVNDGPLYVGRNAAVNVTGEWTQTGPLSIIARGSSSFSPVLAIPNGGSFTYAGTASIKLDPAPDSTGIASLIIGDGSGAGVFTTSRGFERTVATGDGASVIMLQNNGKLVLTADVTQLTTGQFQFQLGAVAGVVDTKSYYAGLSTPIKNQAGKTGGLTKRGNGTLELFAASQYQGDTLVGNGKLKVSNATGSATGTGAVIVESGAVLTGNGSISGAVALQTGSMISPGATTGTLTTGAQTWAGGGAFRFEVAAVDPSQTSQSGKRGLLGGADWLAINGSLSISATVANPFVIDVAGLMGGVLGSVENWSAARNYSWTLATASGGISGFATDRFVIDAADFAATNDVNGVWSINRLGNSLLLEYAANGVAGDFDDNGLVDGADFLAWQRGFGSNYNESDLETWRANFAAASVATATPVPEPTTIHLLAAIALASGGAVRKRLARASDGLA